MATATLDTPSQGVPAVSARRGYLALLLQEAFTVAARLRANRQVAADAVSFRAHIKQLLATADAEARRAGYDPEHIRIALFAYIAYLDETVLNSTQPMFADWARQPLQEEVFGDHTAGEVFFRHLENLLRRQDSEELADVLDVYELCLLLGFRGRYGAGDPGALEGILGLVRKKIARAGGIAPELSPAWRPAADETIADERDPWLRRLGIAGLAVAAIAVILFVAFRWSLRAGAGEIQALVAQLVG